MGAQKEGSADVGCPKSDVRDQQTEVGGRKVIEIRGQTSEMGEIWRQEPAKAGTPNALGRQFTGFGVPALAGRKRSRELLAALPKSSPKKWEQ